MTMTGATLAEVLKEIDGPVKKISPILEIRAANYYHLRLICGTEHGMSLKQMLEQQTLSGCESLSHFDGVDILWASNPHVPKPGEVCEVPHFDHSSSCEGVCHGDGVYRLFEIHCLVPAEAETLSERVEIGDSIRLKISSSGTIHTSEDLIETAGENPEIGRLGRDYGPGEPGSEEGEKLAVRQTGMGLTGEHTYQGELSSE